MSEKPILGDTRTVYEQLGIAIVLGALVIALGVHQEPTWIDVEEYADLLEQDAMLLDIRPMAISTSAQRAVAGATLIPARELRERLDEVPRDRPVIVIGTAGNDSRPSYDFLKRLGYDVYDIGPSNRIPRGGVHRHEHGHEQGR